MKDHLPTQISHPAPTDTAHAGRGRANLRLSGILGLTALAMVGLSFASVPLYDLFCRVTGFGGTPQRAAASYDATQDTSIARQITVRFDASLNPALDWRFQPVRRDMTLNVGDDAVAFYRAHNLADTPTTGTATFNVTPEKAGPYFVKIDCFCFTEQTLQPGEAVDMPVSFYIDPEIADDPELDDVGTITLSYTFFALREPAGDGAELAATSTGNAGQATP